MQQLKIYQYTIVLEPNSEGGYTITVPSLPGCITEGETFEEAIVMAKDAIHGYLTSLIKHNEPLPIEEKPLITTSIEIPFTDTSKKTLQKA